QNLFLHAMGEAHGAANLRPGAAVALRDDVDEILRVVQVRIALVRAEVRAVLEPRLRDHAAVRQVLVCAQPELEIRLTRLRLAAESRQSDRSVPVTVTHLHARPS